MRCCEGINSLMSVIFSNLGSHQSPQNSVKQVDFYVGVYVGNSRFREGKSRQETVREKEEQLAFRLDKFEAIGKSE